MSLILDRPESFLAQPFQGSLLNDEQVARICHEANRQWCMFLGDNSQPYWEEAPEWQKASVLQGVQFHRENPDAGDEDSHNNWMKQKLDDGWVYGEAKSEEHKTHPALLPFDRLPIEQQFKDRLFRTIVRSSM